MSGIFLTILTIREEGILATTPGIEASMGRRSVGRQSRMSGRSIKTLVRSLGGMEENRDGKSRLGMVVRSSTREQVNTLDSTASGTCTSGTSGTLKIFQSQLQGAHNTRELMELIGIETKCT